MDHASEKVQKKVYLVSSYFYPRLVVDFNNSRTQKKNCIRPWKQGKDVYEYDYLAIPVNERYTFSQLLWILIIKTFAIFSAHWFLVIVKLPAVDSAHARYSGLARKSLQNYLIEKQFCLIECHFI